MKKIILFVFCFIGVFLSKKVFAFDSYTFVWSNMYIEVEKDTSIYDYIDLPCAVLYKNGIPIDEQVVYLKGDAFSSISEINTAIPGVYFLTYYAITNAIEEQAVVIFRVIEIDRTPPVINQILDINVEVGTKIDFGKYFVFKDESTDDNKLVIKYETKADLNKAGTYDLTVVCVDLSGNQSKLQTKIYVSDSERPVITLIKDIVLEYGSEFNVLEYVKATDNLDGNISSKITYSTINLNIIGYQNITFYISDSSKNDATLETRIKIVDTKEPEIVLKNGRLNITIQEAINANIEFWRNYLYSYTDNYDTFKSSDVIINDNEVKSRVGEYLVYYSLKDYSGNETIETLTVNVICDSTPVINITNPKVKIGSTINYYQYIQAVDTYDGDISMKVEIDSSNVNLNKEGIYVITVKVKNSSGVYAYKNMTVYVIPEGIISLNYLIFLGVGILAIGIYLFKKKNKKI